MFQPLELLIGDACHRGLGTGLFRQAAPIIRLMTHDDQQLFKKLGLHKNGAGKRGPTPLLQKQIERLNRLPKTQQKVVLKMLDGVLSQTSR